MGMNMSNTQDSNSKAQAGAGESLNDVAQSTISSTEKDALSDSALDGASGGALTVLGGSITGSSKGQYSTGPNG